MFVWVLACLWVCMCVRVYVFVCVCVWAFGCTCLCDGVKVRKSEDVCISLIYHLQATFLLYQHLSVWGSLDNYGFHSTKIDFLRGVSFPFANWSGSLSGSRPLPSACTSKFSVCLCACGSSSYSSTVWVCCGYKSQHVGWMCLCPSCWLPLGSLFSSAKQPWGWALSVCWGALSLPHF